MRIAIIQTELIWNEPEKNVKMLEQRVLECKESGAELVILPEMFTTGFSLATGKTADKAFEYGINFLKNSAVQHNLYITGSMPGGDSQKPHNSLFVYGPEGELGKYNKLHLFSYGKEDQSYSPGDSLLNLTINGVRASFFICYDLRFGIPFSALADKTDLFVVVANWPAKRSTAWRTLLQARAIENQAYCLGVNCVGEIGGLSYSGDSLVISPDGQIILDCGSEQGVFTTNISKDLVSTERAAFSALKDRRWKFYSRLFS